MKSENAAGYQPRMHSGCFFSLYIFGYVLRTQVHPKRLKSVKQIKLNQLSINSKHLRASVVCRQCKKCLFNFFVKKKKSNSDETASLKVSTLIYLIAILHILLLLRERLYSTYTQKSHVGCRANKRWLDKGLIVDACTRASVDNPG